MNRVIWQLRTKKVTFTPQNVRSIVKSYFFKATMLLMEIFLYRPVGSTQFFKLAYKIKYKIEPDKEYIWIKGPIPEETSITVCN